MATITYPYDPTGVAATNKITNELRSVQPPADINQASLVIPLAAPFFQEGFEIWTGSGKTGQKLNPEIDFYYTHEFVAGSNFLGKPLYGSVTFTNSLYSGNVYFHYQTLGGAFTVNDTSVLEAVSKRLYADVRFVTWDQLIEIPSAFPPNAHEHPVTEFKTLADVVTALNLIASTLVGSLDPGAGGGDGAAALALIRSHINASSNAHTPDAVGLGLVANFSVATNADVIALRGDRYMTPSSTGYMISRYINTEDLPGIRNDITTLETEVTSIKQTLQNHTAKLIAVDEALSALNTTLLQYRQEVAALTLSVEDNANQVNIALTYAMQAQAQAAATEQNLQTVMEGVNNTIFSNTIILQAGTHFVNLPAGQVMQFELIGGGAGSGNYYTQSNDLILYSGQLSSGEDSSLWFLGTRNVPIEPVPMLIAGGGLAGTNSYGTIGRVNGGNGGSAFRFRGDRVKVSAITNINLAVDLVAGTTATAGTAGPSGDTSNAASVVNGVGGYTINASGDNYHQTYGRGGKGNTRAGLGGSGAKWSIIIENDTTQTVRLSLNVARGGLNERSITTSETINTVEKINMSGVAILTLVE